jgi:small-conductance mechanosensitive channel
MRRLTAWFLALLASLVWVPKPGRAVGQDAPPLQEATSPGAPVVLDQDTLFYVQTRLGPFTPEQRATATVERIRRVARDWLLSPDTAVAVDNGRDTDVMVGSTVLFTVTESDADSARTTRPALAAERARAVTAALETHAPRSVLRIVLTGAGLTLLATVVFFLLLKGLARLLALAIRRVRRWRGTRIPALRLRRFEVFSSAQIADFLIGAARALRSVAILVLGWAYVSLVFSFFPWTRNLAGTLLEWVLEPLRLVGAAVVAFVPKLIFILVIVLVARFALRLIHLVFRGIGSGRLELPNFPAEWAEPTYKLVRLFVVVIALIVVFPYLPGSQSDAFRGVSVFVGLLLSLGSTAATANLVAGVVLTYMRPFRVGDRVRIADTTGDVLEKTLLVTRIRTIKNEDITIPNAMVLSSHIVNFSSSARNLGLILYPSVTIGYDTPWRTVHDLLLKAAAATDGILKDPQPFVLQTGLDDSYVRYELNAYTDLPNVMHLTYARLHENIQDAFGAAGVEILSPHYAALRDGNTATVPASHSPADHRAKAFRVQTFPTGG